MDHVHSICPPNEQNFQCHYTTSAASGDGGYTEPLVASNSHSQITCARRTTVCTMGSVGNTSKSPREPVAPTRSTSPRSPRRQGFTSSTWPRCNILLSGSSESVHSGTNAEQRHLFFYHSKHLLLEDCSYHHRLSGFGCTTATELCRHQTLAAAALTIIPSDIPPDIARAKGIEPPPAARP